MKNVDIIIPIYNGLDDLKKCLVSIKKHTDLKSNRLILVNDKSPDQRVLEYLIPLQEENIILIDSPVNEGFSASVNKGICYSDRDVILLNSDTVVTSGWVEKIIQCAYSDEAIGTVTPLSNSATLCSVPIICQDNDIPEGRTIEEYAEIIEKCSMRKYPEITVAVGFCMHIKREVINQVGLFDGKTFERGYGEENDFCNRAGLLGYKHVLCDDTLIYHKGTVSFVTEEKQKLIDAHSRILDEWYPYQMRKNHLYCMTNPDQYIRDNVEIWNGVLNDKSNILLMVQSDFREDASDHRGGTQFHVKDLVQKLKSIYNVYVAARDQEFLRLTIYVDEQVISFKFYIGFADEYPQMYDMRIKPILKKIIEGFAISLIHVHHVYNLSFDVFDLAKELDVPYVITVHDYYYICPVIKMNNCNGTLCIEQKETELCSECLNKKCNIAMRVDFVDKWRRISEKALQGAKTVIFPSESAKLIFSVYYPDKDNKYQVIEHGLDRFPLESIVFESDHMDKTEKMEVHFDHILKNDFLISGWAFMYGVDCSNTKTYLYITDSTGKNVVVPCEKNVRYDVSDHFGTKKYAESGFSADILGQALAAGNLQIQLLIQIENRLYLSEKILTGKLDKKIGSNGNLNIAFLGGLVPEKGSHMAYQLINRVNENINWFVIGGINDPDLNNLEQENLMKYGAYEREETFKILKEYKIDIVCILPTWPETFCYTLSEAWLAGIPVICTSIGALTERFHKNPGGWMFELSDRVVDDIENLLMKLSANLDEVKNMKEFVKTIPMKTVEEMCAEYDEIYHQVGSDRRIDKCLYQEFFLEAFRMEKNRFYGDMGVVAERKIEQTASNISKHYEKLLQEYQSKYDILVRDYGNSMRRLDRIRNSVWYKLYVKLKNIINM